jgi:hypothetical protein
MAIHRSTHFLPDGAPCHASKRIKQYLVDKLFQRVVEGTEHHRGGRGL